MNKYECPLMDCKYWKNGACFFDGPCWKLQEHIKIVVAENKWMRAALSNLVSLARPHFSDDAEMAALEEADAAMGAQNKQEVGVE